MNNCNYVSILQGFEDIPTLKFMVIRLISLISIHKLAPTSIGFYSGIYLTTMCDMVTVGLTVSEKVQDNKQTNGQTDKNENTIVAVCHKSMSV